MPRIVEMSEIVVYPIKIGNEVLETEGISTCICIALKGTYQDKPFLLMHHWDGLESRKKSVEDQLVMEGLIDTYFFHIEQTLGAKGSSGIPIIPIIDTIAVIGGQKMEMSPEGEILLTGTEREIILLNQWFLASLAKLKSLAPTVRYHFAPFVTEGEDSVTVSLNALGKIDCRLDASPTSTLAYG